MRAAQFRRSAVSLVITSLALSAISSATATRDHTATYSPQATERCFKHQPILGGTTLYGLDRASNPKQWPRKFFPAGMTYHMSVLPVYKRKVDDIILYFFKSDALAKAGEKQLVSTLIFGKGTPTKLKQLLDALNPPPPTAAAARNLHRVAGNVVVLWNYPRHHAAASDNLVNRCLSARRQ